MVWRKAFRTFHYANVVLWLRPKQGVYRDVSSLHSQNSPLTCQEVQSLEKYVYSNRRACLKTHLGDKHSAGTLATEGHIEPTEPSTVTLYTTWLRLYPQSLTLRNGNHCSMLAGSRVVYLESGMLQSD